MRKTRYILTFLQKIFPFVLMYAAVYIPARLLSIRKPVRLSEEVLRLLLHLSVVALLSQTITAHGTLSDLEFEISRSWDYYNFIPFRFVRILFGNGWQINYYFIVDFLGNIGIFMPLGFLYFLLHRSGVGRAALFGACVSVFIEVFQIFLPRTTDIDDVILNSLGALFGALLAAACVKLAEKTGFTKKI